MSKQATAKFITCYVAIHIKTLDSWPIDHPVPRKRAKGYNASGGRRPFVSLALEGYLNQHQWRCFVYKQYRIYTFWLQTNSNYISVTLFNASNEVSVEITAEKLVYMSTPALQNDWQFHSQRNDSQKRQEQTWEGAKVTLDSENLFTSSSANISPCHVLSKVYKIACFMYSKQ